MRRIIVDSGSSIKLEEKELYGVEILPIQLMMGKDAFLDGVNLSTEEFYSRFVLPLHAIGDQTHLSLSM